MFDRAYLKPGMWISTEFKKSGRRRRLCVLASQKNTRPAGVPAGRVEVQVALRAQVVFGQVLYEDVGTGVVQRLCEKALLLVIADTEPLYLVPRVTTETAPM